MTGDLPVVDVTSMIFIFRSKLFSTKMSVVAKENINIGLMKKIVNLFKKLGDERGILLSYDHHIGKKRTARL